MKNGMQPEQTTAVLTNDKGEYLAFCDREYGFRFTTDVKHARKYKNMRGANIAAGRLKRRSCQRLIPAVYLCVGGR